MASNSLEVGIRIKKIRLELGLSMTEFGKKIDNYDSKGKIKSGTVSNWETGKNLPNNERLKKIAELGNTSVEYLLTGKEPLFADIAEAMMAPYREIFRKIEKDLLKSNDYFMQDIDINETSNTNTLDMIDFIKSYYTSILNGEEKVNLLNLKIYKEIIVLSNTMNDSDLSSKEKYRLYILIENIINQLTTLIATSSENISVSKETINKVLIAIDETLTNNS